MRKVRWGILSTAAFGVKTFIPSLLKSERSEVVAIASRSLEKSRCVANQFGAARAYGSYEELLADPTIEVIYNPLPNYLHVPMTLAAARAGKHVLCEKPIALNTREAEQLRAVKSVQIAEAFMVRFHPQWVRARELMRNGDLGEIRAVQTVFSYSNRDPNNIRNRVEHGGGALYDIGCYAVVTARYIFEAEPIRVLCTVDRDPDFGTDRTVTAILDFGNGKQQNFTVSTQAAPCQSVRILGTRKRLTVEVPFNAPAGKPTRLFIDDGQDLSGATAPVEIVPSCDQYTLQADAFSSAVCGETKVPYGVEDAICNMKVIDALFRSADSNQWEHVD
jgi:predicted dehydrogenase